VSKYTTNLLPANWQPVPLIPILAGDALGVLIPAEYFTPDSDLGKAAFRTGVLPSTVGGVVFGALV